MARCRYVLYTLDPDGPRVLADCPDKESIGVALVTIMEENRDAGMPAEIVGVLDTERRRWLTSLWAVSPFGSPFAA